MDVNIAPISFIALMLGLTDRIELYQFSIKKNNEIEVRLRLLNEENADEIYAHIKDEVIKLLCEFNVDNPKVTFSSEMPILEKSGKFKNFKTEM